ncbi:hypothetical protein N9007_01535 [bacterium]|jgi:hypothetical protein|nr:hypothetical protein [bacterium]MDB4399763.1 hypothetical protein [bacterium]MDC3224803.1 hypothetical protein [Mariniblastus sp.]
MNLFSANNLKSRKIEIARTEICADSPEVRRRLDRISQNYDELDSILEQLEAKMKADDRLSAFEGDDANFELTFGIKRKRKWRSPKSKSKSNGRPRKPR